MSYRNLAVCQLARRAVVEIHQMTLSELPKFEMVEEGAQIRRFIQSVKSNLVEGYGRRRLRRLRSRARPLQPCNRLYSRTERLGFPSRKRVYDKRSSKGFSPACSPAFRRQGP